ncbi:MAG: helix-turn-helix domain-containing protein [Solirubrobacterales bacterium]
MGSIDLISQNLHHQSPNVIDRSHLCILRAMQVTPNPADLGTAIRDRRRHLGITQDNLAASIGVSRRVIGQLENGKETVHLGIVLRAARAVGLNVGVEPRG